MFNYFLVQHASDTGLQPEDNIYKLTTIFTSLVFFSATQGKEMLVMHSITLTLNCNRHSRRWYEAVPILRKIFILMIY